MPKDLKDKSEITAFIISLCSMSVKVLSLVSIVSGRYDISGSKGKIIFFLIPYLMICLINIIKFEIVDFLIVRP